MRQYRYEGARDIGLVLTMLPTIIMEVVLPPPKTIIMLQASDSAVPNWYTIIKNM